MCTNRKTKNKKQEVELEVEALLPSSKMKIITWMKKTMKMNKMKIKMKKKTKSVKKMRVVPC